MLGRGVLLAIILFIFSLQLFSQEEKSLDKLTDFPVSFIQKIGDKSAKLESRLVKQTERYLLKMARKEARMKKKFSRIDSVAAKNCFAKDPNAQYQRFISKIKLDSGTATQRLQGTYMPYMDSLKTSLAFLNNNPQLLSASKVILPADIQKSFRQLQSLQSKMQQADQVKQFLQQRKQYLSGFLQRSTKLPKALQGQIKSYNKQLYYYNQQVSEYKAMLNDPDKMLRKALVVLNKVPAFTKFMQKNSMLASLFNMPGGNESAVADQSLTALQTRDQVMAGIQNQTGPNINGMVQQSLQSAQGQATNLRDKILNLGGSNGELGMPDFKPNNQKTKSFFKRLEYGTNVQSVQAATFFPTTTDLGMSVGYKLNDKSTIGIGASYKMGWGKDIRHITITHQGMSVRTFIDVKLQGSFYASGGFEYNYQPLTPDSAVLLPGKWSGTEWRQSGLAGISKIVSLRSKVFRKTRLQLLWDFLSYRQTPQTQAFRFRVGYNF